MTAATVCFDASSAVRVGTAKSGVPKNAIRSGTAGVTIRKPEESSVSWPPHALLIVFSDGIESRWNAHLLMPLLGRDPMLVAAILMRDHSRGRDDSTVVVVRRNT